MDEANSYVLFWVYAHKFTLLKSAYKSASKFEEHTPFNQ